MKIGLVQCNLTVGDFKGNCRLLLEGVHDAARQGADLAVCSELALCGYPPRDLLERPAFVAACRGALAQFAAQTPICTIVGFIDSTQGGRHGKSLRNAAAVLADGNVTSIHHKSLLPTYDIFDEWRHFEPADTLSLATVHGVRVGVSICEDIWNDGEFWPRQDYPRDPIAELVAMGAELLINVSASPFAVRKRPMRRQMLAAQAGKHKRPLIFVNQVGGNDHIIFDGGSGAFSADGTAGAQAHEFSPDVLVVDVDLTTGITHGPQRAIAADDERGLCATALDALVLGTRDYVRKCGFKSVLVALSGGIDSALTAAIAVRALGPENVYGISLPSRYSSEHSKDDARELADAFGIDYRTIAIEAPFQAFLEVVQPSFAGLEQDVTEENIQARSRAVIMMALSNKFGHLVLTTGNKSELAVGYCTLYGDMSGGLAVIADVPKTMVYQLSREFNRQEGRYAIPRSTLEKPPSAELRPGQTDQDNLPPYEILDPILELYVEQQRSGEEIMARGYEPEVVRKILRLIRLSEYKRTQAAPGLKISAKAFGPGRRIPLAARWSE